MSGTLAVTSCSITPMTPPVAAPPFPHDDKILFQGEDFKVGGAVGIGAPAAPVREFLVPRVLSSAIGMGWRASWIQLCCQEEVWGLYRGAAPADGTMLAKWPACDSFDTESRDNRELWVHVARGFYVPLSSASPNGTLEFKDVPQHYFEPALTNTITGRKNVLAVAVVRLNFILALAAKDPDDNLHVLKHMTWYCNWEANFRGPADDLEAVPVAHKTGAGQGNPQDAAPPKLMKALQNTSYASSNVLAQDCRETSYATWQALAHVRPLPRRN